VSKVRDVESNVDDANFTAEEVEANPVRCPDPVAAEAMYAGLQQDTVQTVLRHTMSTCSLMCSFRLELQHAISVNCGARNAIRLVKPLCNATMRLEKGSPIFSCAFLGYSEL
jgi:hypothetical protein